jgi:PAS domain S-box-containing protein
MNQSLLTSLLHNAALLLAMVAVLDLSTRGNRPYVSKLLVGLVLGIVGGCLIFSGQEVIEGVFMDSRTVLLGLTGLFFGPVPTAIATVIVAIARSALGGEVWLGISFSAAAAAVGLLWRVKYRERLHELSLLNLLALGFLTHAAVIAVFVLMGPAERHGALQQFALPVLLIHPLATVALGLLLVDRSRRAQREAALADSEERYRSIFEDSRSAMLLVDPRSELIVDANPTAQRFYGRSAEELRGQRVDSLRAPIEPDAVACSLRHRRADGQLREVEITNSPILVGDRPLVFSLIEDVTERRRSEQALRESESRFRQLFMANPHPMWVFDVETLRFLDVNEAAQRNYGYSREEFLAMTIKDIRPPEDVPRLLQVIGQPISGGPGNVWRHRRKDGVIIEVEVTSHMFEYGGRRAELVLADDVTRRLQSERALRASEERWQFALEGSGDGVWDWDVVGGTVYLSRRWHEMLGYRVGVIGPGFGAVEELIHPEDRVGASRALAECIRGQVGSYEYELRLRCADGTYRWVLARGRVVERSPSGAAVRMIGTHSDVTERRRANERLQLLDTAIEAMPVGVVITDREGRIQWVNGGFCRMTGYTAADVIGLPTSIQKSGRHPPEFYQTLWQTIQRGEVWAGEIINRRKDGSEYFEDVVIAPVAFGRGGVTHYIAMKQDITRQQRLEQQLARAQRLESIGLLASGIAHDLNNVLTPITVSIEFLKEDFPDHHAQARLDLIGQAAQRGAGIVRQVLTFARGEGAERRLIDPNVVLKEIAHFARETLPRNIEVRVDGLQPGALIEGDMTQLHQALLNLLLNARDAMPNGGTLGLRRADVQVDEESARERGIKPGLYVEITVIDSGTGIAPDVMDRIFDPFFTTKPRGQGTGLGLSAVYGVARSHGGLVDVISEPNQGSAFVLLLPAVAAAQPQSETRSTTAAPVGGGRLVLVVDDEAPIRMLTNIILKRRGFEVMVACDGVEGLDLFRSRPVSDWSLALVDMMMPRKSGGELIRELREIAPTLPIISTSGYAPRDWLAANSAAGESVVLPKPFTEAQLMGAITSVLARPATPPS